MGLPFEDLCQYFDPCPEKAEINALTEENSNLIPKMQTDELDIESIQLDTFSDLSS
ncbi:8020_t:CDS:2 [Funneliformis mosseae]|uniref:8020_t:CDS:1 n=1 Tax=Funneliformis mosseae TaxID=27381 RepID=A0A9N9H2P1_FUNMO|nr:8020_t:CDS:2 [Funneliformis mosseae]